MSKQQIIKDTIKYGFPFNELETEYKLNLKKKNRITDLSEIKKRFKDELIKSIKKTIRNEKRIGLFLSGGIDSIGLAIILGSYFKNIKINVYTASFTGNKDELDSAKKVVEKYPNLSHKIVKVNPYEKGIWKKIIKVLGRPICDGASIPLYKMAEQAKKDGIRIVLTGDGNDELWCGYDWYYRLRKAKKIIPCIPLLGKFLEWTNLPKIKILGECMKYKTWKELLEARFEWDLNIRIPHCWAEQRAGIIKSFGLKPIFPYLSSELVNLAYNVPMELKLKKDNKWIIKEVLGEIDHILLHRKKREVGFPYKLSGMAHRKFIIKLWWDNKNKKEGMKIAFLTQFYPPKWVGGTEIASQNIVRELRKKHEVDVITSQNSIPKLKIFLYLKSAIKKLRKNKHDIIHCQSTLPALAAYLSRKPYVVYCRGSDVYLAKGWRKVMNKIVLKNAREIIALTKDMQKKIKGDYGLESAVIPNGIDTSKYKLDRQKLRKEFGVKKDEFIILYVGTLKKVKGIEYLIKAFKEIENKNKNIKLWIVGGGKEEENLKNLAKKLKLKNIKFLGKKDNKEIPKYAKASDLFVLPSLSEGFPVSILEAMAAALPVIATKVGGVPEMIKDRANGFIVEPKDSKEIAEKVLLLIKNQKLRVEISKNNLKEVKKYSWGKMANQLEQIYKRI